MVTLFISYLLGLKWNWSVWYILDLKKKNHKNKSETANWLARIIFWTAGAQNTSCQMKSSFPIKFPINVHPCCLLDTAPAWTDNYGPQGKKISLNPSVRLKAEKLEMVNTLNFHFSFIKQQQGSIFTFGEDKGLEPLVSWRVIYLQLNEWQFGFKLIYSCLSWAVHVVHKYKMEIKSFVTKLTFKLICFFLCGNKTNVMFYNVGSKEIWNTLWQSIVDLIYNKSKCKEVILHCSIF